jgi:23S rRNA (cytidine1920-2'-O)/16S rRNA (cytidine1409-2'-O)-methyltransferase
MKHKVRLDQWLHERWPEYSRRQLQGWIMQRRVKVDGVIVDKAGTAIAPDAVVELDIQEPKYVSRAGNKLEKALDHFNIDVQGLVAMDAGLSTGGFTDCLLQRGVTKVYGVDVGYGQVHEKIRQDHRVVVLERTNLRHLELATLGEQVDLVTLDLSFISILKVMDAVANVLKSGGTLVTLIKPQFEAEKHQIGKGGIIKDAAVHAEVIERVTAGIMAHGYTLIGVTESPILGSEGNKEFLAAFTKL